MVLIAVFILCFERTLACRSQQDIHNITSKNNSNRYYFSNSSTWGGWSPPEGYSTWFTWITLWGSENTSNIDSTEEGRGPETGWPQYWIGLGHGNSGVPPPPWAYLPSGYGKPQYCHLQPVKGGCEGNLIRWGFNPTTNECQTFENSGCGGNQNNFGDKHSCNAACVDAPSDCEVPSKINFEEIIYE